MTRGIHRLMTHFWTDVGCEAGKFADVGVLLVGSAQRSDRTLKIAGVESTSSQKYAHPPESFHASLNSVSMVASRNTPGRLVHGRLPYERNAPWTLVLDLARL